MPTLSQELGHAQRPWEVFRGTEIKTMYGHMGMDQSQLIPCILSPGVCLKANGLLIAAAPELLEAVTGILGIGKRDMSNPKYDSYFEFAKNIIDKAIKGDKL